MNVFRCFVVNIVLGDIFVLKDVSKGPFFYLILSVTASQFSYIFHRRGQFEFKTRTIEVLETFFVEETWDKL